jgi:hypothetical protein
MSPAELHLKRKTIKAKKEVSSMGGKARLLFPSEERTIFKK